MTVEFSLVAARHDEIKKGVRIPPAMQTQPCSRCGALLWLAPASVRLAASGIVAVVCRHCLIEGVDRT